MAFDKGHLEFHTLDMAGGWHGLPGYPPGFSERIIAGKLDEGAKRGNRTRMLRIEPGAFSTKPFVHDYWEEVFLLSGDLIVGSDAQGRGGEQFRNYTYAVRPPGAPRAGRGAASGRDGRRTRRRDRRAACRW